MRLLRSTLFLALCLPSLAQVTHEEQVVRASYAKLSFAAQLGMVWHTARGHSGWPSLADSEALRHAMENQLRFELSGFKVGNVSDVLSQSWDSFVTSPDEAIKVEYREVPFTVQTPTSRSIERIIYADASWIHPQKGGRVMQHVVTVAEELPHITSTGPALTIKGDERWQRYASFAVVATLAGKSLSYRAMFLFRKGANGHETVLPLDFATQMGLVPFLNTPMYPSALVETSLREIPFVQGWLAANNIAGCKKHKQPEVCCEASGERCGIAAEDLEHSLQKQIDPLTRRPLNPPETKPNTTKHRKEHP